MYFLQRRHSPYHSTQLLHPSFAYMLAHPEERIKCTPKNGYMCHQSRRAASSEQFSNSYIHAVEEADRFLLYTDLPGVKVEDLSVELNDKGVLHVQGERRKGEASIQFHRQFVVDDQLIDTSKITAKLSDGALEIVAPKREASKPRRVAVVAGSPPAAVEGAFSVDLDIPGVKVDALQLQMEDDGRLLITGERKRAGQMTKVHRVFTLNRRVVDSTKLEAFLEDGVLTICAPAKKTNAGRVISVSTSKDEIADAEEDKESSKGKSQNDPDEAENVAFGLKNDLTNGDRDDDIKVDGDDSIATSTEEEKKAGKSTVSSSELEYEVVPETVSEDDE